MPVSPEQTAQVASLLGREPRGLEAVAVSASDGAPMVIRVSALVDGKPFPTLFWLVDSALCYRIDQAEAAGLIAQFQSRVDADPGLQDAMREDHLAYIRLRDEYMSGEVRQALAASGYEGVLARRGVGGIADFSRIRCLHTWYGAHLVLPNTIGAMLDEWWAAQSA
ncbi:MAG: DUF501 domain-containing protein [Halioglobus sp.]